MKYILNICLKNTMKKQWPDVCQKKKISVMKMVFLLNTEHIGNLGERSHGSDFFL